MGKKKGKLGGKREGAGRPPANPEGVTMLVAVSVPVALVEALDDLAERKGWKGRSQAVTEAIRKLLGRK
jgi:hypothetical protein